MAVTGRKPGRRWLRIVVGVLTAVAIIAPAATLGSETVTQQASVQDTLRAERTGGAFMRQLTHLLGALVQARSAAVAGDKVDSSGVRAAVASAQVAQTEQRQTTNTASRWSDIDARVIKLIDGTQQSGATAAQSWSPPIELTQALIGEVGDRSGLAIDGEPGTHFLTAAVVGELPGVIVGAGQVADAWTLAGGRPSGVEGLRIGVVRDRLATAAEAATTSLGKVGTSAAARRIGAALLTPLDQFGAAADVLAPSVEMVAMPALSGNVAAAAVGVRVAALALAEAVWPLLDSLLTEREDALATAVVRTLVIVSVAVILGIVLAVLAVRRRRRVGSLAPGAGGASGATGAGVGVAPALADVGAR